MIIKLVIIIITCCATILHFTCRFQDFMKQLTFCCPFFSILLSAFAKLRSDLIGLNRKIGGDDVFPKGSLLGKHRQTCSSELHTTKKHIHRGYYTLARRYEFYVRVKKQYPKSVLSEGLRYRFLPRERKINNYSTRDIWI